MFMGLKSFPILKIMFASAWPGSQDRVSVETALHRVLMVVI